MLTEERREQYVAYMRSPEWRARRDRALRDGGEKCAQCNSQKDLHVHHWSYERLGREQERDLEVLCKSCHRNADMYRRLNERNGLYMVPRYVYMLGCRDNHYDYTTPNVHDYSPGEFEDYMAAWAAVCALGYRKDLHSSHHASAILYDLLTDQTFVLFKITNNGSMFAVSKEPMPHMNGPHDGDFLRRVFVASSYSF